MAQAGDGAISYRKYMGGGEYPFLQLGTDTFVSDFGYGEDDERLSCFADFTGSASRAQIPDSLLRTMKCLNRDGSVFFMTSKPEGTALTAADLPQTTPTLIFDSNEVKISDVLSRMNLTGYTFLPSSSAWKEDDVVTLADDGSTSITLRFSAN